MPLSNVVTLLLVACTTASAAQDAREFRTVQTAQGPVRGYKTDDVFHFYGIPYATAPTGRRRFTAPLPGPVWKNPLEAVDNNIVCPQSKGWLDLSSYDEGEKCLVVNIHMSDTNETSLPVVVYIHGGAYQAGFGNEIPGDFLTRTKKVVLVTFNYRLGVHGFLCLGTENAPGNAGMKDQVALLRWVQKNIANFGGNPSDVTIAGYSAGSASVELLMLSNMSQGLFNKAILESGASVGVWGIQLDAVQNAKDLAKQLNFTKVDDIAALDEFYSVLSYEALTSTSYLHRPDSMFLFVPCVERDTSVERFLDDTPVNILKNGKFRKVPTLYGISNLEGTFQIPVFEQWKDKMNERFSDFLPADLHFKDNEEREQIAQVVKKFYFGAEPVSLDTVQGYIDYFSDVMFAYPCLRSVKLQVEAGSDSIFLFEYSFFTPFPKPFGKVLANIKGARHAGLSSFLINISKGSYNPEKPNYKKMKEIIDEIWTNFIITGKPVPEGSNLPSWPPVGKKRSPHMELSEEIQLKGSLLENRFVFWDQIYERFYRSPLRCADGGVHSNSSGLKSFMWILIFFKSIFHIIF